MTLTGRRGAKAAAVRSGGKSRVTDPNAESAVRSRTQVAAAKPAGPTCTKADHGPQVVAKPCPKCGFQWGKG